jgi:outer membrane lipoprotein SlyB
MPKLLLIVFTLWLTACASSGIGRSADATQAQIKRGVIESIKPIQMDNSSNAGTTAGSIFGQVGGASTGAGRGAVVGSVFGAVLGGTLGQQAGVATKPGLEIWVKLDEEDKSTYVMQPGKPDAFKVGDHVRVLRKKEGVRVELESAGAAK